MHELHIVDSIIKNTLDEFTNSGLSRIINLNIKIGKLSGISKESFINCFKICAKNPLLEKANLDIEIIEGKKVYIESFDGE